MTTQEIDSKAELLIESRYPILYFVSWEEERLLQKLSKMAKEMHISFGVWSSSKGMLQDGVIPPEWAKMVQRNEVAAPLSALEYAMNWHRDSDDAIFVLKDFHPFLKHAEMGPVLTRKLRDVAAQFRSSDISEGRRSIILLSPVLFIPPELEKELTILDYPLPDLSEIEATWGRVAGDLPQYAHLGGHVKEDLFKAAQGLTETEAADVFRKLMHFKSGGPIEDEDIDFVAAEKEQIVLKSRTLEFCTPQENFSQVGGLDELKQWLNKRVLGFSQAARDFGLPDPKGMLLLGVPGCGKSMSAKVVAAEWHMPLLRLDIGRIFGGLVGSSEENVRNALKVAESVAPCILWLDEIEKGFVGVQGGGDSGVTARVFGTMLTWMQEKTKPVFVIATANDVRALPPELLRKGRFDEIFFVDLPGPTEREAILRVHINKRANPANMMRPGTLDYAALSRASEGFSGAEIEQAIETAMFEALFSKHEDSASVPDYNALIKEAMIQSVPLSKTMADTVKSLRDWAETRARFASKPLAKSAAQAERSAASVTSRKAQFSYTTDSEKKIFTLPDLAQFFEHNVDEGKRAVVSGKLEQWLKNNYFAEDAKWMAEVGEETDSEYRLKRFINRFRTSQVQST